MPFLPPPVTKRSVQLKCFASGKYREEKEAKREYINARVNYAICIKLSQF